MRIRDSGGGEEEGRRRKEGWISENTSMFKFLRQKFIYRRHTAGLTPSESMQGVPLSTQRSPWASPSRSILLPVFSGSQTRMFSASCFLLYA